MSIQPAHLPILLELSEALPALLLPLTLLLLTAHRRLTRQLLRRLVWRPGAARCCNPGGARGRAAVGRRISVRGLLRVRALGSLVRWWVRLTWRLNWTWMITPTTVLEASQITPWQCPEQLPWAG